MSVSYQLHCDDGQEPIIAGITVVGRRPSAAGLGEELDGETRPRLIEVADPERSVSRVHLLLGIFEGELWVQDLGSGNGTRIHYPDGASYPCTPGERFVVDPGCTITCGDRTFRVGAALGESPAG